MHHSRFQPRGQPRPGPCPGSDTTRSSHQTRTAVLAPQRKQMSPTAVRRSSGPSQSALQWHPRECAEQAGIKEMQFGRLCQTLQLVPKPRFQPTNEEQLLQNRDILPSGLVVKSDLAAHLCEIGELARVVGENLQQPRHLVELFNVGNLAHISLHTLFSLCMEFLMPGYCPASLRSTALTCGKHSAPSRTPFR
jgi:hypothetical protein